VRNTGCTGVSFLRTDYLPLTVRVS
jgi:hypothetical protein